MRKLYYFIIILTFIGFNIDSLFAQEVDSTKVKKQKSPSEKLTSNRFFDNWSININGGSNLFYGDLRVYHLFPVKEYNNEREWAYGIILSKKLSTVFTLQGQLLKGKLAGAKRKWDDGTPARMYFNAEILERNLNVKIDINNIFKSRLDRTFSIYALAGIGLMDFRAVLKDLNSDTFLGSYGYSNSGRNKEKMTTEGVIPVGFGFDFRLNKRLNVNLEFTLRGLNTDKLDVYKSEVESKNDKYGYSSLGITYKFGGKKEDIKEIDKGPTDLLAGEFVPTVITDIPAIVSIGEEFYVRLFINKGEVNGAGKIQNSIPDGFFATPASQENGQFEFNDQIVSFYWDSLPKEKEYSVTYKVKVSDTISAPNTFFITGEFVYKQNEEFKRASFKNEIYVKKAEVSEQKIVVQNDTYLETIDDKSGIKGVEYRVQIRASLGKNTSIPELASKYNIKDTIKEDSHNGWYKYSVGSFTNYNDASNYKKKLIAENNTEGAFVVAFKDGKRLNSLEELTGKESSVVENKGTIATYTKESIIFKIQIFASNEKNYSIEDLKKKYSLSEDINEEKDGDWYKYTVGNYNAYANARLHRDELRKNNGLEGVFVVSYNNQVRIPISEAIKALSVK